MDVCRASTIISVAMLGFAAAAAAGEIRGTVRLDGAPPAPTTLPVEPATDQHPLEGCGTFPKQSQRLLTDPRGGVQHAVVWVERPALYQSGTGPAGHQAPVEQGAAVLDQRECVFEPHVLLIPAGGTLAIRNPDPVLHNVRIFQERAMLMHEWQQPRGPDLTWRFDEPGRYVVRCGVHAWMHAWIVVAEHGYYALTDATGGFTISDVPQGDVVVHVWHESLGEQQQRVTVTPGQSVITVRLVYEHRRST